MTQLEIIAALVALHNPAAQQQGMVYEVWEDGEVTLQKGGSLYGQRSLHGIHPGDPSKALPPDSLPIANFDMSHSRIQCIDSWTANEAVNLIKGPYPREGGTWLVCPTRGDGN